MRCTARDAGGPARGSTFARSLVLGTMRRSPGGRPPRRSRGCRFTRTGSRASGMWPPPSITSICAWGIAFARAMAGPAPVMAVPVADDDQDRASPGPGASVSSAVRPAEASPRISGSAPISWPQPTQSSICLVECGSVKALREEELEEAVQVATPVVGVVLGPTRSCRGDCVERDLSPRPEALADGRQDFGPMVTNPATRSGARPRRSGRAAQPARA